jgi:hypothetical protein
MIRLGRRSVGTKIPLIFHAVVRRPLLAFATKPDTQKHFDPAFCWAETNREVAQRCLNPPPATTSIAFPNDLDDFWHQRGWKFPVQNDDELPLAHALVSHVLHAPLTLATLLQKDLNKQRQHPHQWCCIGARAEATLPLMYWKELLLVTDSGTLVELVFCGPDIVRQSAVKVKHQDSELHLQWEHRGFFHEWSDRQSKVHAYILLNPGLGHPNLRVGWKPTLDLLFKHSNTERFLMTAHSELDAERDASLLKKEYGLTVDYRVNPFASRIRFQDPFDDRHIVQPDHYIAYIN